MNQVGEEVFNKLPIGIILIDDISKTIQWLNPYANFILNNPILNTPLKNINEDIDNLIDSENQNIIITLGSDKFECLYNKEFNVFYLFNVTIILEKALQKAQIKPKDIDLVVVTEGPGLIGSLLVGINCATVFAYVHQKPILGVNHLTGHIYAAQIENELIFPSLALLVSGGHTKILLIKGHCKIEKIGTTLTIPVDWDLSLHHAIETISDKNKPNEINLNVLRKGYLYKKKLIKPAMVKVNKCSDKNEKN